MRGDFISMSDKALSGKSQNKLEETLSRYIPGGSEKIDWMGQKYRFPWPYFSRYTADGVRKGLPWDLADAQGDRTKMPHTWYVGGSVVFESVNDIIAYNLRLLRRHGDWSAPFEESIVEHHTTSLHHLCKRVQAL